MSSLCLSLLMLYPGWGIPNYLLPATTAVHPREIPKPRITEISEVYPKKILEQKLNQPGLAKLDFMFRAPARLYRASSASKEETPSLFSQLQVITGDIFDTSR